MLSCETNRNRKRKRKMEISSMDRLAVYYSLTRFDNTKTKCFSFKKDQGYAKPAHRKTNGDGINRIPKKHIPPPAPAYLYSSPPQVPFPQQTQPHRHDLFPAGIQAQWRHWAGSMSSNLEPQEYLNSANALMQLGGHGDLSAAAAAAVASNDATDAAGLPMDSGAGMTGSAPGLPWPNGFFGPDGRGDA